MKVNQQIIERILVQQRDQTDCGVACLLTLVQFYEGSSTIEKLRELSGTTTQGTTLLGLYQAAKGIGFDVQGCESDIQGLIDHKKPVILHVVLENRLQHYVVCFKYEAETESFLIADPSGKVHYLSKEELDEIWKSKTCLTLKPNDQFVQSIAENKSKKDWFVKLIKDDYNLLSIALVLSIGMALLGMAMAIFSQKLIDDILPAKDMQRLWVGITLLALLLIVRNLLTALRQYFLLTQSKDFNNRITDSFFSSLLHLPKPFFDTRKIGDLVARLNDTSRIQRVIAYVVGNVLIDVLMAVTSLAFLFYYSIGAGCIALISLPIYFGLIYRFNKRIIEGQKSVMQAYALNESNYINSMQGIATIKNNNRQPIFKKLNKLVFANYQDKIFSLGEINIKLSLLAGIAGEVFLVAILAYGSVQVFKGGLQLGELMAVLGISGALIPSVSNLALISIPINEAKIAFNRMFEFTSIQPEKLGKSEIQEIKTVSISDVSFRFPGRSPLLQNINIKLTRGQCVALIGESGSGKSTLGQILQGFYQIETGMISINGTTNLNEIALESWREKLGVISQEIDIFNGTVIDNIVLGQEDTVENVVSFVKESNLESFIAELPQGLATILGEEGINLSGGQKQLVALARMLYKKPQVIILDEITSAMDKNAERITIDILKKLKESTVVFFVSHRLHTLRDVADQIYILSDKTIVQHGTHDELMLQDNFYSQYWKDLMMYV
ncbi:MAG: peptidase domain-containing ABC transporter [Flavobacteriales bacterium]|nr:peptidase domain-containing ABC transporter [Flavobacteriales bacterium]